MHLRNDFEQMQAFASAVRQSPMKPGIPASPARMMYPPPQSPFKPSTGLTPQRNIAYSPYVQKSSPFVQGHPSYRVSSPQRRDPHHIFPINPRSPHVSSQNMNPNIVSESRRKSNAKRIRYSSSDDGSASSSERSRSIPSSRRDGRRCRSRSLSYSASEDDWPKPVVKKIRKTGTNELTSNIPVVPPKPDDEEDIGSSSDSEYTDEDEGWSSDDSAELDDLRSFIDFREKYNNSKVTRKNKNITATGDQLHDFLFVESARPRKWFKAFAQSTVGAKLNTPGNTPSKRG